jgi:hypothetical protein
LDDNGGCCCSGWNGAGVFSFSAGDVKFVVGPVEMNLKDYFVYVDSVKEESILCWMRLNNAHALQKKKLYAPMGGHAWANVQKCMWISSSR